MRGHISHGAGRVGKHRKHPSGHGNAGGQHMHRISFDKYHPGYFGKVGIRVFNLRKPNRYQVSCNLSEAVAKVSNKDWKATKGTAKAPIINLLKFGYHKLLGGGDVPPGPVIIKARSFSKIAEQKVKKAGGACVLVS